MDIQALLVVHEGERLKPYRDTKGLLTIGVGRCLDREGISSAESRALLANDISAIATALAKLDWYRRLDAVRSAAMVDMAFNLGIHGLLEFHAMIDALTQGNFAEAARQAMSSEWAREVGIRADDIEEMILTGQWPARLSTGANVATR